jgi:hypothetical protein
VDVDRGDGAEGFSVGPDLESKLGLEAGNLTSEVLSDGELSRFTLNAGLLEVLDLTKVSLGRLVSFA